MLLVAAAGLIIWSLYMNSDVRYRAVAHAAMDTLKQQQIGEYGSERIVSGGSLFGDCFDSCDGAQAEIIVPAATTKSDEAILKEVIDDLSVRGWRLVRQGDLNVSARFCGHDGELQAEVIRTNDSVRRIKYLYDIKNCQ